MPSKGKSYVSYSDLSSEKPSAKAGPAPMVKMALIAEVLNAEEDAITQLNARMELLRDRLSLILNVDKNRPGNPIGDDVPYPVPLGETIIRHIEGVNYCRDIVEDILERLEI